jgi:hypothetical protein
MTATTAEWRLRTPTGQELTIRATEGGAIGEAAVGEYSSVLLAADLAGWLAGPDAWSRGLLVEMAKYVESGNLALAHGTPDDELARIVMPVLMEAVGRGRLVARVRDPAWEFPAATPSAPEPDGDPPLETEPARAPEPRRISVRLGDLDAVFEPVASVHGKKQRLQALGHSYERFTAATGGDATQAYRDCLAYWQAKRERALGRPFASAAELERDLQSELRRFVVEGGALPGAAAEVRIRLPGAITIEKPSDLEDGGVPDGQAPPSLRFQAESALWDGNGALGKIPIVARIEVCRGGSWVAAAGEQVCFQLVPPFYDDPGGELDDVQALRNTSQRPALKGYPGGAAQPRGPRQFITDAIQYELAASDPQRFNAHHTRGGKRGLAVLGNVIAGLPGAGFPGMSAPEAAPARASAVRVETNAAGEAGVLFLPARTAGDRYRLRVFLDPNDGAASDGTEHGAVAFETGRLCVWKHILWSQFLTKQPPRYPPPDTVAGVQARLATLGYDVGELDGEAGPRTEEAVRGFQRAHPPLAHSGHWEDGPTQETIDRTARAFVEGGDGYRGFGPVPAVPAFAAMASDLRRMYCELEIEPAAASATVPPLLTPERHRAALRWAIAQAQAALPRQQRGAKPRDLTAMFAEEFETPFLFEIRHPHHYDRLCRPGFARVGNGFGRYWRDAARILHDVDRGLLRLFLRHLTGSPTGDGLPGASLTPYSTPGLTVLTAMATSRLQFMPSELGQVQVPKIEEARHPGETHPERAVSVMGGPALHARGLYLGDGFSRTVQHEMGHLLYLRHQFAWPDWRHRSFGGFREDHDSTAGVADPRMVPDPVPYDRCLMGYLPCEGELCGKCQLKLRGWDISRMPT